MGEKVVLVVLGIFASSVLASTTDKVAYHLSYDLNEPEIVQVQIDLPDTGRGERVLVIPRAIPMGYAEVSYDRFVEQVSARSKNDAPVSVVREAGPRWRLGDANTTLSRVEYSVNVATMEQKLLSGADSSKIRKDYLGLLGYSVFGYIEGFEQREIELTITVPATWPVFSTLSPRSPPASQEAQANAANFYALADSQVIAGPGPIFRKLPCNKPLFLALHAEAEVDEPLLAKLIEESMAEVIAYYDSVPFDHYTVHYEFVAPLSDKHNYGFSMEHMDSCTIFFDVDGAITATASAKEILRTRYNLAHHFAHSWIPKRACGEGYFPFTWEHAPILDTVWLSEGFVQYAAVEMITDGLVEKERRRIRNELIDARFRRTFATTPDFIEKLSLVELSRVASTKYSEDFRYGRNVFSRGAMMAMELDELIRERTGGKKRFRDCMRHLMAWSKGERRGFKIAELTDLFKEATGVDVSEVMDRWLTPQNN